LNSTETQSKFHDPSRNSQASNPTTSTHKTKHTPNTKYKMVSVKTVIVTVLPFVLAALTLAMPTPEKQDVMGEPIVVPMKKNSYESWEWQTLTVTCDKCW
jgi:hypothetical protein